MSMLTCQRAQVLRGPGRGEGNSDVKGRVVQLHEYVRKWIRKQLANVIEMHV